LLKLNCSAVIDLSELARADQALFARVFIETMLDAPPELINPGRPRLIVIDEAHRLVPEDKGEAESRAAVIRLMDSGRKRGLGVVLVTQRFAKVAKSAIGECNALLIGRFASDVDQRRAAEIAGIPARQRGIFGDFEEGEFMASGLAFGNKGKTIRFRTNPTTVTVHPKIGMQIFTPPPAVGSKLAAQFKDLRVVDDGADGETAEPLGTDRTRGISEYAKLEFEVADLRGKLAKSESDLAETRTRYEAIVARLRKASAELAVAISYVVEIEAIEALAGEREAVEPEAEQPPAQQPRARASKKGPAAKPKPQAKPSAPGTEMRNSSRLVLSALSMFPGGLTKGRIGTVTGLTPSGGSFNVTIKELRVNAWIEGEGSGPMKITKAGLEALGSDRAVIPKPGRERAAFWRNKLRSPSAQKIMDVLLEKALANRAATLSKEEIGEHTGLVTSGGSFNVAMKQLRDHDIMRGQKSLYLNPDILR
jgi:hypothetical protein